MSYHQAVNVDIEIKPIKGYDVILNFRPYSYTSYTILIPPIANKRNDQGDETEWYRLLTNAQSIMKPDASPIQVVF